MRHTGCTARLWSIHCLTNVYIWICSALSQLSLAVKYCSEMTVPAPFFGKALSGFAEAWSLFRPPLKYNLRSILAYKKNSARLLLYCPSPADGTEQKNPPPCLQSDRRVTPPACVRWLSLRLLAVFAWPLLGERWQPRLKARSSCALRPKPAWTRGMEEAATSLRAGLAKVASWVNGTKNLEKRFDA